LDLFLKAVAEGKDIVVDRMGFNVQQRARYLVPAKARGYETKIIVLHEPYKVCFDRCIARIGNHETIVDEKGARQALQTFFTKYERPIYSEADLIEFRYPQLDLKPWAVYCDLDGTLCNVEHRRHHVRRTDGARKDWKSFFDGIADDTVNEPVKATLWAMTNKFEIVYCSGRADNYRKISQDWLDKHGAPSGPLYMRNRQDSRQDYIVKEILLDFEILCRYQILFCLDDRDQVVEMLRSRGLTVFQVAKGNF
jgi:hypothetical protein